MFQYKCLKMHLLRNLYCYQHNSSTLIIIHSVSDDNQEINKVMFAFSDKSNASRYTKFVQ